MNLTELNLPEDLQRLSLEQLRELAEDIRQVILSTCLKNGGHLGASLGTVELAIALHKTFRSPDEPIVWDVGHQAYAHKLLTGRAATFDTLRTTGGVCGFLTREESIHDAFGAGHSSTSISAALGMAWNNPNWSTAVIGDGGLTAGIALEALNNVSSLDLGPFILVLNDNQMSISENVGGISKLLASGEGTAQFFESFGFDYVGPVDGHDLSTLLGTLEGIKKGYAGKPILLHVRTLKGKGYTPAEQSPAAYHGISPVQVAAPNSLKVEAKPPQKTWSEAFGEALCKAAERDDRVVAITAAMPEGTGLTEFATKFPQRFFDVGIAEPHAVTFAAGMATRGLKPFVAIYSTFLQRSLDQIIHDVALQNLPVTFAVDRAGLVGADGPTHHGSFDLAYFGMIPRMTVTAPSSIEDLEVLISESLVSSGPFSIRYPRGKALAKISTPLSDQIRRHQLALKPKLLVVTLGTLAERLEKIVRALDPEGDSITLLSTVYAKPLPSRMIELLNAQPSAVLITVEDGSVIGGFGQHLFSSLEP
ncbi:MAG: 1-deoxy-D-xylulose-5-phosphate synthase, partial [Methylotenera sp.]|nr:1-deoxy-D-xylulose-5-phosphate synthase [Oligoflexia bacterium]